MKNKLLLQAIIKYIFGVLIVGLLIFIPAGSLKYINGLLFMCLLFIPMLIFGIYLFFNNPKLLKERLDAKEKESEQKEVVIFSGLMFLIGFVLAGLNYRYNCFKLPDIVVYISSLIFIIFYILYAVILKQNSFLSRTIKVEKDQKVIDKGMYSILRHPMYSVTIVLFLTIPLILNSIYSFIIFLFYPLLIIKRINNEEKVLEKELKGYKEYKKKVKYKLIPYIY